MIPVRLELENFLSYGTRQDIDFAQYPLICLSGKNGHGKSALLDAMTWAIWGQARKVAGATKPDAHLLRIGQTFMTVTFEFEFNGLQYRIKREYAKTYAKPYASLDFGIIDPHTGTTRALTDKTIRKTQELITHTIGLDYDTFINSAFLRQGSSNEFSKKSAKERKHILSAILGLANYELLKRRALDKSRELSSQKKYVLEYHEKVKVQLQKTDGITKQLADVHQQLKAVTALLHRHEKERERLTITKEQLAAQAKERTLLEKQYNQLTAHEAKEQAVLRTVWSEWRTVNNAKQSAGNKQALEQHKQQLTLTIAQHQKILQQQLQLKEKLLALKEQHTTIANDIQHSIEAERQQHTLNRAHQEKLAKDVSAKIAQCNAEQQQRAQQITKTLKTIAHKHKEATQLERTIAEKEKQRPQFEKRKNYYHHWLAQAQQLTKEQQELAQKKQLSLDPDNPSCPLCEQNLSAARKRFIQSKLVIREHYVAHRLHRLKEIIPPLKHVLLAQHTELEQVQKQKQELERLRSEISHAHKEHETHLAQQQEAEKQHGVMAKELSAIQSAQEKSTKKLKELATAHEKIYKEHELYQKVTRELKQLTAQASKVQYDQKQHEKDSKQLANVETQLATYAQLGQELEQQAQRKQTILGHLATLRTIKQQCTQLQTSIAKLQSIDAEQKIVAADEKKILEQVTTAHKEKESLTRHLGSLEHEQQQLKALAKQLKEEQKNLASLDTGSFEYSTIATALGKDGIQALLIEETIPEIEHEANALLGQLTDNQAHIMIESLRDLKKGGTKETLDINISDAQGIRPYELFSGGEAFRIDFALRIAISKLLARRAGTSLQTLIIDEGFGSQDEEGLHRLMEAIYAIQDNFCKIIIVSHLTSLKEQFPVHFVVDKSPQGSKVHVIEQG